MPFDVKLHNTPFAGFVRIGNGNATGTLIPSGETYILTRLKPKVSDKIELGGVTATIEAWLTSTYAPVKRKGFSFFSKEPQPISQESKVLVEFDVYQSGYGPADSGNATGGKFVDKDKLKAAREVCKVLAKSLETEKFHCKIIDSNIHPSVEIAFEDHDGKTVQELSNIIGAILVLEQKHHKDRQSRYRAEEAEAVAQKKLVPPSAEEGEKCKNLAPNPIMPLKDVMRVAQEIYGEKVIGQHAEFEQELGKILSRRNSPDLKFKSLYMQPYRKPTLEDLKPITDLAQEKYTVGTSEQHDAFKNKLTEELSRSDKQSRDRPR